MFNLSPQLSLGLEVNEPLDWQDFYPGSNLEAVQMLKELVSQPQAGVIYLWGQQGVGKTSLLQVAYHEVLAKEYSAIYVSLADVVRYNNAILDNLEHFSLVCLDDFEAVSGHAEWEEKLFVLYNELQDNGGRLIVAANKPPKQLGLELKDLESRLTWGLVLKLKALSEHDMVKALRLHANKVGLALSDEVGQYLIHRYQRDMPSLLKLLQQLDVASLSAQRRLTVPFVRSVLAAETS